MNYLGPKHGPHGHPYLIREAWALRYGMNTRKLGRILTDFCCWQLCLCKDDEARRLLLGCSR